MTTRAASRRRPSVDPLFRLLWVGEALASISEQLFVVCLTLLVLDVAGPGATLGLVLAVAAAPRAVLLPFGGVLADRVDPARIVVVATWLRTAVLATLAGLVVQGSAPIVLIAGLAGLLGVLDAVYYPASLALLPQVVAPARLPRANAMVQGAESAGDLIGPAVAAGIVAVAGPGGGLGTVAGLSLLAAIVLAAFARRFTRARAVTRTVADRSPLGPGGSGLPAIRDGLRYAWSEPVVRTILLVLGVLNVAVVGPVWSAGRCSPSSGWVGPRCSHWCSPASAPAHCSACSPRAPGRRPDADPCWCSVRP